MRKIIHNFVCPSSSLFLFFFFVLRRLSHHFIFIIFYPHRFGIWPKKRKEKEKGGKNSFLLIFTQTKTTQTTKKIFFQTILDSRFCLDIIYSRPRRREPALSDVTETRRRRRSTKGRLLSSSWGASSRVVWNVVSQLSSSHSSVFWW